jgi:dihydropteroate synthase
MVNDVSGCEDPDMAKILAQHPDKYLVLGHHRGIPVRGPGETVTADEVCNFLERRSARCQDMGMRRERLYGDVGFGFGKNKASNLDLLSNLSAIGKRLGLPLVAGVSRKRFLRQMWGDEGADLGSVALAAVAVCQGVEIVRCHAPKLHLPLKEIVR